MNAPVLRLFALVVVLFGTLVAFTSRWTVFEAEALRENPANRRELLEEQRIRRGTIRAADGTLLARSVAGRAGTFHRRYPTGPLFGHPVGYAFTDIGRASIEQERNDALTGRRSELTSALDTLLGSERVGDDLVTTLDAGAQDVALRALGGRAGAVVALDAATGAVRVMASTPGYDPNGLDDPATFRRLRNDDVRAPLINRTTFAGYPPGSTFKVVTAAAALDSGSYTPETRVNGDSPKEISGVPLANSGDRSFGEITLTTALTFSVNTVWAQVGEDLGKRTMAEYMERFGFYEKPPLDYPESEMLASGERGRDGRLLSPTSGAIDVGRMAIGQDKLSVTPLQMASVAQTVANGGVRMRPRLAARIVDPDGRTVERIEPQEAGRVMSRQAARELGTMMRSVVREGTGTAAALQGVEVAGKTGTAEIDPRTDVNQPWFIGFSGGVAIAVTVERSVGGQGGTVAAPIAKQVLEALGQG